MRIEELIIKKKSNFDSLLTGAIKVVLSTEKQVGKEFTNEQRYELIVQCCYYGGWLTDQLELVSTFLAVLVDGTFDGFLRYLILSYDDSPVDERAKTSDLIKIYNRKVVDRVEAFMKELREKEGDGEEEPQDSSAQGD